LHCRTHRAGVVCVCGVVTVRSPAAPAGGGWPAGSAAARGAPCAIAGAATHTAIGPSYREFASKVRMDPSADVFRPAAELGCPRPVKSVRWQSTENFIQKTITKPI
jgi:hypothetical protein